MAKAKPTEKSATDPPQRRRTIDAANARRLAVRADVTPQTIQKELGGARVRGMAGERARKVLIEAGLIKPDEAA